MLVNALHQVSLERVGLQKVFGTSMKVCFRLVARLAWSESSRDIETRCLESSRANLKHVLPSASQQEKIGMFAKVNCDCQSKGNSGRRSSLRRRPLTAVTTLPGSSLSFLLLLSSTTFQQSDLSEARS